MKASDDERDPLDRVAEEYLARMRRGERPALSDFAACAPGRADELLSALVMVEDLKPRSEPTLGAARSLGGNGGPREPVRLGDFRIVREVGRGGMGVVHEAEQVSLGRRVALKVLSPHVSRSSQQIQRFVREARSAAQLHHTNIVPVFGVGDQDGLYYYAMQFIDGDGLDHILEELKRRNGGAPLGAIAAASSASSADPSRDAVTKLLPRDRPGPNPAALGDPKSTATYHGPGLDPSVVMSSDSDRSYARSVARIGVQVADALAYAHQQGTLRRDIKPSNLLLDRQGNVWVADFGLAKAAEDDDLTQTGDLVGTIRYMAPERFRGEADERSDLHALGLTLYELLAFRPAYDASGRHRLLHQITEKDPPRLRSITATVPRDLETIVHKAIEREAKDRYPSAAAMGDDLRCFLEHRPIEARKVGATERPTRWARRNPGLATLGTRSWA